MIVTNELLYLLEQFGGGGEDPGNNAVRFLLALFFWAGLCAVAYQQYGRLRDRRDLTIAVAATVGGAREAVMFLMEYGAWRGWFPPLLSYRVFPPLEHALTDIGRVILGFAYLRYYLPGKNAGRTYLRAGVGAFVALYLITAPLWVRFLDSHPEMLAGGARFGLFWGDFAFRLAAFVFMGFVVARLATAAPTTRKVQPAVYAGFVFIFLDEFLMLINLSLGDAAYRGLFAPVRHNLGIWAIPFFIWAFWGELLRQATEEKTRSEGILTAIGDGIGIEGPDHRVLYQNPAHRAMVGEHAGESCAAMRPSGVEECLLARSFREGTGCTEGRTLRTPAGALDVEVSTSLLRDPDGRITGGIEVVRDITARRRAEEALRESEARYRTLVENIDHGITLIDTRFRIVMANAAHRRLVREPGQDATGKLCYAAVHGRSAVCPDCPGAVAIATRKKAVVERSVVRPDGSALSVRIQAFPVLGPDGAAHGFIELVENTTEQKKAEAERRRLEERIQQTQKMESLGILAGGIAHDFNNLLMGILGNTDLALAKTAPESPARPFLKSVDRAAQRAADLTNQMLAYSGKGRFVVEPINLSRVVEEIGHLLATVVSKRATVRYHLAADLPPVEADATQIRQVVMNLITNASDALGEAEGTITVATGVIDVDPAYLGSLVLSDRLEPGPHVFVEVSDNGAGMDEATRARIFDPFFTTKHTGRGLGLAAVLGIVRGHHGAIKVYSEPGRGSTFKVLLPALLGAREPAAGHPEAATAAAPGQAGARGTVLVVDDEPMVRETTRSMLEEAGYSVLTACDGAEGVEVFRANAGRLAAVILDMTMPRMGGEEAFREMRRIDETVPVILSSGFNEQDAVNRFIGKGLAGFIQKPYRLQALLERLETALARRAGRRPADEA
ncbi:MAG TPA: response regulator [bacterium]